MSISSRLLRVLGNIEVEEIDDYIYVYNLRTDYFGNDLKKIWSTSRIFKHMFTTTSRNKMVFHKFFAIEFYFLIRSLKNSRDRRFIKQAQCQKVLDELYEKTWLKNVKHVFGDIVDRQLNPEVESGLDYTQLKKFNFDPYHHQKAFFEMYALHKQALDLRGFYLTAPPGSGKTLSSLMLRELLRLDKLVIVCPLSAVKKVWIDDTIKHYKKAPKIWNSKDDEGLPDLSADIIIVHYQALGRLAKVAKKLNRYKTMITVDEGHNLNDIKAKQTQLFIEVCKINTTCDNIIWASGTPIKSIGTEAIPFFATVCKGFNKHLIERFKKLYGSSSTTLSELLANRLGLKVYTVPKSEVVDGKPIEETLLVKMPNGDSYTLDAIKEEMVDFIKERVQHYDDNKRLYEDQYLTGMEVWKQSNPREEALTQYRYYTQALNTLKRSTSYMHLADEMAYCNKFEKEHVEPLLRGQQLKEFRNAKSAYKYPLLKIRGEALGRILGKRRIECHVDMIDHANLPDIVKTSLKKTIIFTDYVEVVDKVNGLMKKEGFKPLTVTGRNSNDLPNIVDKFGKQKELDPLVATLKTLSTAVPLTMANTLVFTNKPFRIHILEQAIARAWRIGQDEQVYVFHLELDTGDLPNINTRNADIMAWSKEQVEIITGVKTTISMEHDLP